MSKSSRVTKVKPAKGVVVSEFEITGPIDRIPGTPGSDTNVCKRAYKGGKKKNDEQKILSWAKSNRGS